MAKYAIFLLGWKVVDPVRDYNKYYLVKIFFLKLAEKIHYFNPR